MPLSRETIIQGALGLLDEVGLDNFTTRRLAQRLGIQSPTLYWHFKSKRALLDAMAHAMLQEHSAQTVPPPGTDWRAWCQQNAQSFRRALLSRRDGARVHAGTQPAADQLPRTEAAMRLLSAAGFSLKEAASIIMATSRFVVGWVTEEQAMAMAADQDRSGLDLPAGAFPLLSEAMPLMRSQSPDALFDFAVSLLLRSLRPDRGDGLG